jgi:hypothetical protein
MQIDTTVEEFQQRVAAHAHDFAGQVWREMVAAGEQRPDRWMRAKGSALLR